MRCNSKAGGREEEEGVETKRFLKILPEGRATKISFCSKSVWVGKTVKADTWLLFSKMKLEEEDER